MSRGTRQRARSPDGPGTAGLWEGQSWAPAGKERVCSGGYWERKEGKGEDREVQGGLRGEGVLFAVF